MQPQLNMAAQEVLHGSDQVDAAEKTTVLPTSPLRGPSWVDRYFTGLKAFNSKRLLPWSTRIALSIAILAPAALTDTVISKFVTPASAEEQVIQAKSLKDKVIDYSASTFVQQCAKFSHPVGRPEINLAKEQLHWEIDYLPDITGAYEKAVNPVFQENLVKLARDASDVVEYFWGTISTDSINPVPRRAGNSTSYPSSDTILREAISQDQNITTLFYNNKDYHYKAVVYIGNDTLYNLGEFSARGGMEGNFGVLIIPAQTVDDYAQGWSESVAEVVHERGHGEKFDHKENPPTQGKIPYYNFMNSTGNRWDTLTPYRFDQEQANQRCGGGRIAIPLVFNVFLNSK